MEVQGLKKYGLRTCRFFFNLLENDSKCFLEKHRPYKNDITAKIEELPCERANKQENWEVRHTQQN